jgi:serine/threonine protein kinase
LAVGRQSFVFAATDRDSGQGVVVKQPAFDYRKPLLYSRAAIHQARESLAREHDVLSACTTGHLPRPIALLTDRSPIPSAQESTVLRSEERFLVEERIDGQTLTRLALQDWPTLDPKLREVAARRIAREFLAFWESLRQNGWHYGDLGSDNLIVESAGGLRVVDGGSAVPAGERVILTGYTPAFTTPRLYEVLAHGRPVAGDLSTMLPALAKLLHFALTRKEPLNGAFPDLDSPALEAYSPGLRSTLAALLGLDTSPEQLPMARAALTRWAARDAG